MAIVLALLSAIAYGTSDFWAGLASRRLAAEPVAVTVLTVEVLATGIAVVVHGGSGARAGALEWGALSGVGGAVGSIALYRGLAVGQMAVVATLSGVLAAVVPAIVGVALGEHLSTMAAAGIVIAVPAIALVSWQGGGGDADRGAARAGVLFGALAGMGFALLFIALDRAGTHSGAWPAFASQVVGVIIVVALSLRGLRSRRAADARGRTGALILGAGVLAAGAQLLFLAASGKGALSIVAVVTSMYPAFTVVLARVVLTERWRRSQAVGLGVAVVSVVLVSLG